MVFALQFFRLFCLLQLLCAPIFFLSLSEIDMTAFFLVYLVGFFFDAADGPCALLLPENIAPSSGDLRFYEISQQYFFSSFFLILGQNTTNLSLHYAAFVVVFYFSIGWLLQLLSFEFFHTMCFTSDCLYQNLSKKILRLLIKGGGLLLIIAQMSDGLDSSMLSFCDRWVEIFGSFETQGVILLGLGILLSYGGLLISWACPKLGFYETGV